MRKHNKHWHTTNVKNSFVHLFTTSAECDGVTHVCVYVRASERACVRIFMYIHNVVLCTHIDDFMWNL